MELGSTTTTATAATAATIQTIALNNYVLDNQRRRGIIILVKYWRSFRSIAMISRGALSG